MRVSVVIPVYNAAPYVREAVESALVQPQTAEVVLVEDNSPDDSLAVCQQLVAEYDKVKLYRHPNGENRGAGESRNLGIRKSTQPYIAFLDADDFYLPHHLSVAQQVFEEYPDTDGVYGAADVYYEDEASRQRAERLNAGNRMASVPEYIEPDELFRRNPMPTYSLITLVLKRYVFDIVGMFPNLRIHQDTVFMVKLAIKCRLRGSELQKPVVMFRTHANNRSSVDMPPSQERQNRLALSEALYSWARYHASVEEIGVLLKNYYFNYGRNVPMSDTPYPHWQEPFRQQFRMVTLLGKHPEWVFNRHYWYAFFLPIIRKIEQWGQTPSVASSIED